ncbi:hypothetical protein BDZ45DRAFT_743995 [Acephala macrosclerotiorum]|nr:hypothetical protein BDZ45DRAFT_743995 [Acephala macrosclerotiorum]
MPLHQGYSESKWISENLLDAARQTSAVSSAILRVGQIAGPVEESVQWVPVDLLANIVGELVLDSLDASGNRQAEAWTKYFHLCNPNEGKWQDLVPAIEVYFANSGQQMDIVSFEQWVHKLEQSAKKKDSEVERNPAGKLLDFYQAMRRGNAEVKMDTNEAKARNAQMREIRVFLLVLLPAALRNQIQVQDNVVFNNLATGLLFEATVAVPPLHFIDDFDCLSAYLKPPHARIDGDWEEARAVYKGNSGFREWKCVEGNWYGMGFPAPLNEDMVTRFSKPAYCDQALKSGKIECTHFGKDEPELGVSGLESVEERFFS